MKRILLLSLAIFCLFSCQKIAEPQGSITANGSTTVPARGGEVLLHITSNVSWKVEAPEGVTISPGKGDEGDYDIKATVAPNTKLEDVDYTISAIFTNINGISLKKDITLTIQAAKPEPEGDIVAKGASSVSYAGGELTLVVTSNCAWEIVAPEGVTVTPNKGEKGEKEVVVALPANDKELEVSYKLNLFLTNEDGKTAEKSIDLVVESFVPSPNGTISVKEGSSNTVSYLGGEVILVVESNCAWAIVTPEGVVANPAKGDKGTSEVSVTLPENMTEANLSYDINITFTNAEKVEEEASITLTVEAALPDPTGTLEVQGENIIGHNGGDIEVKVTANCNWDLGINKDAKVTPSSGTAGEHTVVVTLPANESKEIIYYDLSADFTHSIYDSRSHFSSITLGVRPTPPAPDAKIEAVAETDKIPFYGGQAQFSLEANCDWEIEAPSGITVDPSSGEAGIALIVVTVPANDTKEDITDIYNLILTNENNETKTIKFTTKQEKACITYAGVDYKIVKLADGRIWMAENLRYVPAGFSASTSLSYLNGFYAPLKVLEDGIDATYNKPKYKVEFTTEEEEIAKSGFYYSTAIAFGLKSDTEITAANAANFEGCQGICPDGWHIPTLAEQKALVGAVTGGTSDKGAPYFDPDLNNGSIAKLNDDNANIHGYGGVSVTTTSATTGSHLKAIVKAKETYIDEKDGKEKTRTTYELGFLNTGYFMGSTFKGSTASNIQFYGLMPNMQNGTINAGYLGYRMGVSVRCIKNQ